MDNFRRGIRFSIQKWQIPASRWQRLGNTNSENYLFVCLLMQWGRRRNGTFGCESPRISYIFVRFVTRFLARFLTRFLTRVSGGEDKKYSVQFYRTLRTKPRKNIRNLRNWGFRFGHFSLILLGEMVINRNSSWRNQTFLSPLLFFFETTRRLCRRVVSEDVPAILSL